MSLLVGFCKNLIKNPIILHYNLNLNCRITRFFIFSENVNRNKRISIIWRWINRLNKRNSTCGAFDWFGIKYKLASRNYYKYWQTISGIKNSFRCYRISQASITPTKTNKRLQYLFSLLKLFGRGLHVWKNLVFMAYSGFDFWRMYPVFDRSLILKAHRIFVLQIQRLD